MEQHKLVLSTVSITKKKFYIKRNKKNFKFSRMNGIDTIDTATSYGNAEKKIGQINPKGFKVVSKISFKGKKN